MLSHKDLRLSIIVNNYNYVRFLKESVDSALAVRCPNKEVIVVDDGSTDRSRDIIAAYGDRILPILKENGGQNSAANAGFARASGDVVIFLDSDDVLFPSVGEAVMGAYREGVAKVQWGLHKTNEHGERTGPAWPKYTARHTPEWARQTLARSGWYDTPPTSGNAWSRPFLHQVFPLPVRRPNGTGRWGMWFDLYLSALAPFFGDVVSLPEPHGNYRLHDSNDSGGRRFTPDFIAAICQEDSQRKRAVNEMLQRHGKRKVDLELNVHHLKHRLMLKRLLPELYPYNDGFCGLLPKFFRAVGRSDMTPESKLIVLAWAALMTFAPQPLAFSAAQFKHAYRTPLRDRLLGVRVRTGPTPIEAGDPRASNGL